MRCETGNIWFYLVATNSVISYILARNAYNAFPTFFSHIYPNTDGFSTTRGAADCYKTKIIFLMCPGTRPAKSKNRNCARFIVGRGLWKRRRRTESNCTGIMVMVQYRRERIVCVPTREYMILPRCNELCCLVYISAERMQCVPYIFLHIYPNTDGFRIWRAICTTQGKCWKVCKA